MAQQRGYFSVEGMHCAACADRVCRSLEGVEGVTHASVNLTNSTARVQYDGARVNQEQLIAAVQRIGFGLHEASLTSAQEQMLHELKTQKKRIVAVVLLGAMSMLLPLFGHHHLLLYAEAILATIVVFWGGAPFFSRAIKQIAGGTTSMDTLIALSTSITLIYSLMLLIRQSLHPETNSAPLYFHSAAMIITFVSVGKWLELRARTHAHRDLSALIAMQPQNVMRITPQGQTEIVPLAAISPGDHVRVRPGERIPADGTITTGQAYIDESCMNGEPTPLLKFSGESVLAGTLCTDAPIEVCVSAAGSQALLGQIVEHLEAAQTEKPPIQHLADRIAAFFVPGVIALSILTLLIWGILGNANGTGWSHGIIHAVALLAIACPCALGLAIPVAIAASTGRAAKLQLLFRNYDALHQCPDIRHIVLDKTGTLTHGTPTVEMGLWHHDIADNETEKQRLKSILKALEERSTHPLSKPIAEWCKTLSTTTIETFSEKHGEGITARIGGKTYTLKGIEWYTTSRLKEPTSSRYPSDIHEQIQDQRLDFTDWSSEAKMLIRNEGYTLSVLAEENVPKLLIALTDPLRPDASECVKQLQNDLGIKVHLISGDRPSVVQQTASACGITHAQGNMLPLEKEEYLTALQNQAPAAAVGDGLNDAPLLNRANLSMAMGSGSHLTIGIADITLLSNRLTRIPTAIRLGRLTDRIIRQNLFWAFFYNVLMIPIAAGALTVPLGISMDPMYAALAMALSSFTVVMNSLRIQTARLEKEITATERFPKKD